MAMDTCLILIEQNPVTVEAGFKKAREYLRRFSFTENRYSSEDQIVEYKRTIARSAQNWSEFLKSGFHADMAALADRPYQWLRLAGDIEIEDNHHIIELFLYPISSTKAGVSIAFSSSVYDAIYSSKPSIEKIVDLNVKQDFVSFLLLIARSFSASGFALKPLTDTEDLVLLLRVADIQEWLTAPTKESIRRWGFLLVGIRTGIVERQQVEKAWTAERVKQSGAGFLIHDGIG
jgi:hypothetical protein